MVNYEYKTEEMFVYEDGEHTLADMTIWENAWKNEGWEVVQVNSVATTDPNKEVMVYRLKRAKQ
jgi:hypothetical protein